MMSLPLFFALVIGFNHAFEADHVLAVGNIANKRSKLLLAVKDGMYLGFRAHQYDLFSGMFNHLSQVDG